LKPVIIGQYSPYQQMVHRFRAQYGDRFVEPETTDAQRRFYRTDTRVEVTTTYDSGEKFVRRGTITTTTGWHPSLMLLHRRSDSGSWDLLDKDDVVTAWFDRRGKRYPL
jgi:hypothetical protein